MRQVGVWQVNSDGQQPVCEQEVSEEHERSTEQSVDASSVQRLDRSDQRSVAEDRRNRPETECSEHESTRHHGPAGEREEEGGIQDRTRK